MISKSRSEQNMPGDERNSTEPSEADVTPATPADASNMPPPSRPTSVVHSPPDFESVTSIGHSEHAKTLLKRALSNTKVQELGGTAPKTPRMMADSNRASVSLAELRTMTFPSSTTSSPQESQDWRSTAAASSASRDWRSSSASPSSQFTHYRREAMWPPSRSSTPGDRNSSYKLSGLTRTDFQLGEILSIPFHTPSQDSNNTDADPYLQWTVEGYVYSKRRMVVVMWIYQQMLFCVPLYTHGHRGLAAMPLHLLPEHVAVVNHDVVDFDKRGVHDPIVVVSQRRLDPDTSVHLTGAVSVLCSGNMNRVGRVTKRSYHHLIELWSSLSDEARRQPY